MKKQQGFTLIELMIVVAIIAILAAIAIPQYQNYVARSQITRMMGESGQLRTAVEDCMNNGRTAGIGTGATECDVGATSSSILGGAGQAGKQQVPVVTITAATNTAEILATAGNNASTRITGDTITWRRNAEGSWSCVSDTEDRYRPAGCPAAAP